MPKKLTRLKVLVVFLCSVLVARRADASVVWTANFEKNKSGDVCGSNNPGAEFTPGAIVVQNGRIDAQVLGEQVYSGNLACKVTVHPDDIFGQYKQDRVDVKHNSTLTGEGKDMYFSGHYYLLAEAQTRDEFGMFETTNSLNWVDIWVEPKTGGGTSIKLGIESNGANLGSVLIWTGDFTPGRWHQIAIHIHWSQDATQGLVDFWLDGQQVVTGFKHKTKPNANDLYYLTGLHRVLMQPYTESIYFDDFIEADTQGDIKIGAPMPQGGSSDAGGSDATATAGQTDAAGTGTSGTTGTSGGTGATGTGATEAGGAGTSGTAGTAGTGTSAAAGTSGTTGTAGAGMSAGTSSGTGTGGAPGSSSAGCALGGDPRGTAAAMGGLAILGAALARRRRR
jgi:MYXO-CTERM domain-containing protein